MDIYTIMLLGYEASQRKVVNLGVYTLKFYRRKVNGDYLYMVTLSKGDEIIERGIFGDYKNAVIYAGQIFYKFR